MGHSQAITSGILSLMHLCPKEAANLRKELLIAARHIFATELRQSNENRHHHDLNIIIIIYTAS